MVTIQRVTICRVGNILCMCDFMLWLHSYFMPCFYMCLPCFYYVCISWNMLCQKWWNKQTTATDDNVEASYTASYFLQCFSWFVFFCHHERRHYPDLKVHLVYILLSGQDPMHQTVLQSNTSGSIYHFPVRYWYLFFYNKMYRSGLPEDEHHFVQNLNYLLQRIRRTRVLPKLL